MAAETTYLGFVPEHRDAGHRVLGIRVGEDGAVAELFAELAERPTAVVLADALNGSLQHRETAVRQLDAVLADVPDDVRAAVSAVLPLLASTGTAHEHLRVAAALPGSHEPGPALFTTTNCPGRCEVCGICRDDCADCPRCRDFDCEVCLPVAITPRTAAALDAALGRLADEVYDIADQTPLAGGGPAADAGDIIPPCVADRDPSFLRRYARAFDDLAADLTAGRRPTPACTAEEIALDLAIQDAERCQQDEPELHTDLVAAYPGSRFDYRWLTLQDLLFQDKDYEGLLWHPGPLSYDNAEAWFGEFGNVPTRDPERGFRR
ncbi:hypothetical protein PV458_05120 [Streptomyces sp. MN03-5084-2B]|nr:hypothetical protein [Streptomyces sp. MN03-5084-2B]